MKPKHQWGKAPGKIAVQPYVDKETYRILQSMRQYNGHSLRIEIEQILIKVTREWKEKNET